MTDELVEKCAEAIYILGPDATGKEIARAVLSCIEAEGMVIVPREHADGMASFIADLWKRGWLQPEHANKIILNGGHVVELTKADNAAYLLAASPKQG